MIQWGYLSDRYGRRPVLLFGPLGLAVAMLSFGMSTTFWPLVVSRCLQGVFNGNIGLSSSLSGAPVPNIMYSGSRMPLF